MRKNVKFRAYDKSDKPMMINWEQLSEGMIDAYTLFWNRPDYIKLMQFTGEKDANQTEVYEGDILSNGDEIGVVVFDNGAFHAKYHGNVIWQFPLNHYTPTPKIVGNVFENPELLK